jgi:hypothetical protein
MDRIDIYVGERMSLHYDDGWYRGGGGNGKREWGRDTVGWCYHTRIIVVGSTTMIFLIILMWKIHSIIDGLMAAPLLPLMGCIVCIDIITIFTPYRCFPSAVLLCTP